MAADLFDGAPEIDRTCLQMRLANLEMLLCELLLKNERMRQERQALLNMHSETISTNS
jgi:hypothetical protein